MKTEPFTGETQKIEIASGIYIEMVKIPAGEFMMGSPTDEKDRSKDEIQHNVKLDEFWIGKYPVTQEEWKKIMGDNPSEFQEKVGGFWSLGGIKKDIPKHPVENILWNDCQEFIKKLNEKIAQSKVTQSRTIALRFRLPTEAEWEYASRGGQNYIYAGSNNLDEVGWYSGNSGGKTHPVGQKKANGFGLCDMSGNVWEWCSDWYDENYYQNSPANNPHGLNSGKCRCLRGGSWYHATKSSRSANRYGSFPSNSSYYFGFRLCGT